MSRPRLVTQKQIRAAWSESKPDVKRLAVVLGVSARSAYRYLEDRRNRYDDRAV